MLVSAASQSQWTSGQFPDLRGPTVSQCAAVLPRNRQHMYICDPDRILNNSQAMSLNRQLRDLAVGTPCHCQRRSQCTTGISGTGTEGFHGFVVSVAIVQNLQMQVHSPSEAQLTERAESFCRALEGRWALGDCGNSVIVFVWEHYKKMIIWPARLAEKYVTVEERKNILSKVNELIQADQWYLALSQVIAELLRELNGEEQGKVDTGTLSLLVAVGLAVLLTLLITCCVCAFRCCGNLRREHRPRPIRRAVERVDSLRETVLKGRSQLRRLKILAFAFGVI
ncbi:unnamed protein product [Angiostrongylus costaricensis]|uniref:Uncharacterized protein n=1 Tax=Angiostrongylus costaricensis TaxID=334426 RepID=A0A158PJD3_ANGCS|nr:unnamed protein product [Angiostrongylus costaricensis]